MAPSSMLFSPIRFDLQALSCPRGLNSAYMFRTNGWRRGGAGSKVKCCKHGAGDIRGYISIPELYILIVGKALYMTKPLYIYRKRCKNMDSTTLKGGKKSMPATTEKQKGTAMDYLAAPRESGIVKSLMASVGYEAPKGGRLPAGVKLDTLTALNEAFTVEDFSDFVSSIQSRVAELQSARRTSRAKLSATPESVIAAVKAGRISLDELKAQLEAMS